MGFENFQQPDIKFEVHPRKLTKEEYDFLLNGEQHVKEAREMLAEKGIENGAVAFTVDGEKKVVSVYDNGFDCELEPNTLDTPELRSFKNWLESK